MSISDPAANPTEFHPYGLPMGTVRGFLSVLICSFFWIVLLSSPEMGFRAPLAHFFLLSLVFLAFASHPFHDAATSSFLPWMMRVLFVGGSFAAIGLALYRYPELVAARLTPSPSEFSQWPLLLGCLTFGFGVALFVRFILGRRSELFQTIRAWVGVLAMLLLIAETFIQFVVLPGISDQPGPEAMKVWEGTLVAIVAGYFGSRA